MRYFTEIAFMIISSYSTKGKSNKHENHNFPSTKENTQNILEELKSLRSKEMPNCVISYKLNTKNHLDGYNQIFPFLNFIARVESF